MPGVAIGPLQRGFGTPPGEQARIGGERAIDSAAQSAGEQGIKLQPAFLAHFDIALNAQIGRSDPPGQHGIEQDQRQHGRADCWRGGPQRRGSDRHQQRQRRCRRDQQGSPSSRDKGGAFTHPV